MSKRAQRKKWQKQFKIGDVVTWGLGVVAHRVVEVMPLGIVVDATSQNFGMLFVPYEKNISHSSLEPDKVYPTG